MNTFANCLSLMELLDVRDGAAAPAAAAHAHECARCRALLAQLPHDIQPAALRARSLRGGVTREIQAAPRATTGTLWRALSPAAPDISWLVVVIGRAPDADDRLLVATVQDEPELALEGDLLLDPETVGYPAFADVNNLGMLVESQLVEWTGALSEQQARWLVGCYRAVLQAGELPGDAPTGVPTRGDDDPRLLAADERAEQLRALWRLVDEQVRDTVDEEPGAVWPEAESSPTLSVVLGERLLAASGDWDIQTLLEASHADGARVEAFFQDMLDLTDKRDVDDLAKVLHTLDIAYEEARPCVYSTLARTPGGSRQADGPALPMAARSQPGADQDEVTRQLYSDQSNIDTSPPARRQEAEKYLAELERALDELT